jgi:Flp pilus assembly protein TadD
MQNERHYAVILDWTRRQRQRQTSLPMSLAAENDRGPFRALSPPDASSTTATQAPAHSDWRFVIALAVAVLITYQPVWNGGFIWDDAAHVTRPDLRSWQGLWSIWAAPGSTQQYYPLTHSFFWLLHRLFGDNPSCYHLVNIGLHVVAASMVGFVLRRLSIAGAWLAAGIFALHPVQAESVAWTSEIKNTLSAALYLGAALSWLGYRRTANTGAYALAFVLFALALCTKSVTATLPAALLLVEWWRRGRVSLHRDVLPLAPFFILGIAAGLFTVWVERAFIGAQGADFQLTLLERCLIAGRALWFYAGKLLWPTNLVFIYPRWTVSQGSLWQYAYPVAVLVVVGVACAVRNRFRGPLAGLLYFAGTLFPALGFFNIYPFLFSFVADHFQYLASLGLITPVAAAIALEFQRRGRWGSPLAIATCVGVLSALAVLTWKQSHIYADSESLYKATIQGNPESWMAHNNLAGVLLARDAVDDAIPHIEKALALKPRYAEARNNLGLAPASKGRVNEALGEYRQAIELQPDYAEAYNNLGVLLARQGRVDEAIAHYRRALEIDPVLAMAHRNLAEALIDRGRTDEALVHLRRAIALSPGSAEARNRLGLLLAERGQLEEARSNFSEAVSLRPDYADAHNNLGIVLVRSGRIEDAIEEFRVALHDKPDSTDIRDNLAAALARRARSPILDPGQSR